MLRFQEKIHIVNGNPYVRPPDNVLEKIFQQAKKNASPIPVRGKIDGAEFQQSLVRYEGDWRLYINIFMAKAANIVFSKSITEIVERKVSFEIEFNPQPQTYKMDSLLKKSLDKNSVANENWGKLPASRKKEILRYFSLLKSEEAKERNLKKAMEVLSGKEGYYMARSWKGGK